MAYHDVWLIIYLFARALITSVGSAVHGCACPRKTWAYREYSLQASSCIPRDCPSQYPIMMVIRMLARSSFKNDVTRFYLLSYTTTITTVSVSLSSYCTSRIIVDRNIYSVKRKSGCLSPIGACVLPSSTKVLYLIKLSSLFPSLRALFSHKQ